MAGYPRSVCCRRVADGFHGNNRLGGNSLQDCEVFGRVAGVQCAKYKMTLLSELSGADVMDVAFVDGSGLAGVSAAKTLLENRGKTVFVDRASFQAR